MHGMDWDAAKAKYEPLVKDVGDRQELLNIINEMIGELNASHTGAAPAATRIRGRRHVHRQSRVRSRAR
jgi:tricorn protease